MDDDTGKSTPMYPSDWPRCPVCGDFAMDGHITCGRAQCNEGEQRRRRQGEVNGK